MKAPPPEQGGLLAKLRLCAAVFLVSGVVTTMSPGPSCVLAQSSGAAPAAEPEITAEIVEGRRKQAAEAKDLDDATRTRIMELYRQAGDSLKRAQDLSGKAAELKKQTATISDRTAAAKADLVSLKSRPEPELPKSAALAALGQQLAQRQSELDALRKSQVELDAEPNRRTIRRKEMRAQLLSAPDRLAELKKQIESPPPPDESPQLTLARRTELGARRQALAREPAALESELALFDAEDVVDLVRMRRDLLTQQIALADQHVKKLGELVNQRRQAELQQAANQARLQANQATNPLLRTYAQANTKLAEEALRLTARIEETGRRLKEEQTKLELLRRDFQQTRDKVATIGLTGPIGLLLRKQRPDVRDFRQSGVERFDEIDDIQFRIFELDEERTRLANLDPLIRKIMEDPSALELSEEEESELKQAAREVLERRREYLGSATRSYNTYFDNLLNLGITHQSLLKEVESYARFVDERVLWIRSSKWLSLAELRRDRTFAEIADSGNWANVAAVLWSDLRRNPVPFGSAVLLFGALAYYRQRFRRELREIGVQAQRGTFARFAPTARATLLTAIISLLGPGIVWYFSWRLAAASEEDNFARAASAGLMAVATAYCLLEMVRNSCRHDGLAEAHFGWPLAATRLLRVRLRWLMISGLPLMFVIVLLDALNLEQGSDALERLAFILSMIVVAVFVRGVLHPTNGLFGEIFAYERGGWLDRFKSVWQVLAVLVPLAISALAFAGYYYTARQLAWRLALSIWLFVACVYLQAFLLRLLLVHRRSLSIQKARERRAAAEERAAGADATIPPITTEDTKGVDLATLSSQTQQLLSVALITMGLVVFWWIWIDMLPALNVLDRWTLWTTIVQTSKEVATSGDQKTIQWVDEPVPITLAHLAAAVLIAVITVLAARNIPGLLEISLLQRLPLDAAARYAATTIAKYLIVLIGIVLASSTIGLGWSKIQWLATALTFGLAFGLQEIFANFVAGLIILFERPIRVGDVVTVADVSGVVSRIRIRATTITNWDRQEFIVPNKEFITGRLLNWTLSDTTNRVVLKVGVAYGTDTDLARKLLMDAAREQPSVLDDPAPMATFEEFGDSTLNYSLRVFLPDLNDRLDVVHDLHATVDRKFREAGIEIAFPQRDIRIRAGAEWMLNAASAKTETGANGQSGDNGHVAEKA